MRVISTPFLKRPVKEGSNLLQLFMIEDIKKLPEEGETTSGSFNARLFIERKGRTEESLIDLKKETGGSFYGEILLPAVEKETHIRFLLKHPWGDEHFDAIFMPERRWRIFVVPHSHTDVGFTDTPSKIIEFHNNNTLKAIEFCRRSEDWPDDSRFRWTCEVSWQVQNFLEVASKKQFDDFMHFIKRGQIEVAGLYLGEHTDLCGHEELVRSLYTAERLRKRLGITIKTAMLNDVPGVTWSFAQILAKSGFNYFSLADNNYIAPFLKYTDLTSPFYWVGPDGCKVLASFTEDPKTVYGEGWPLGFWDNLEAVERSIPKRLRKAEEAGYPFEELQILLGFDNHPARFVTSGIVKEWNEKWAFPQIRVATISEFFDAISSGAKGERIPEHKGDWTNWWSNIAGGFPHESILSRIVQERLPTAEKLSTLINISNPGFEYPQDEINEAYDSLLVFDEHSGGGAMWTPKDEAQQRKAVEEGFGYIYHADKLSRNALNKAFSSLSISEGSGEGNMICLFNPLPWDRMDAAILKPGHLTGDPSRYKVVDTSNGSTLPVQALPQVGGDLGCRGALSEPELSLSFMAELSALGMKVYKFEALSDDVSPDSVYRDITDESSWTLENHAYHISFSKEDGSIASIYDKRLGRELLDPEMPVKANSFIRIIKEPRNVERNGLKKKHSPEKKKNEGAGFNPTDFPELYDGTPEPFRIIDDMPNAREGFTVLRGSGSIGEWISLIPNKKEYPAMRQDIILPSHIDAIDIIDTIYMNPLPDRKEYSYIAFPFRVDEGEYTCEIPNTLMRPGKDQFRGACMDHYAVQGWVDLTGKEFGITLSSPSLPLIDLGWINDAQFIRELPKEKRGFFVRISHLWSGSESSQSPYSKGMHLSVPFRLLSHAAPLSLEYSGITAREFIIPFEAYLPCRPIEPTRVRCLPRIEINDPSVNLTTLKKAEDGRGIILRLCEMTGSAKRVRMTLYGASIASVNPVDMVERDMESMDSDISFSGDKIDIELSPFELKTLRIILV